MQPQPLLLAWHHPGFESIPLCRAGCAGSGGTGHTDLGQLCSQSCCWRLTCSSSLGSSYLQSWEVPAAHLVGQFCQAGLSGAPFRVAPRKCQCSAALGAPLCPLKARQKCVSCQCQHGSPHLTRLNWDLQQIPAEALTNSVNIVFQGNQRGLSQLNGERLTAQGTSLVSNLEQAGLKLPVWL